MRIALLNSLYSPYQCGGAERSTQLLAEALAGRGHAVSVITLGQRNLAGTTVANGVTVHRLALHNWYWPWSGHPGRAVARAAWQLRDFRNGVMASRVGKVLDEAAPQVLNTHSLGGFSTGVWEAASRRAIPIVHTLRDYYLLCPPGAMYRNGHNCERPCNRCRPFAAYRRRASRSVRAVAAISRFILDRHMGAGFFSRSLAARVIFNALDPAQAGTPREAQGPLVFGFIGRLCEEKGIRWLLESFCRGARPGDRLLVAGEGAPGFAEGLRQAFPAASIAFLGRVAPAAFYEQVHVAVVPSLWHEPFGRTAIEPLTYGIPVIATRRGGLAEIVQDGVTGVVVDAEEPESLARAIARFSSEPALAAHLGRQCLSRRRDFSQARVTEAYERLFAQTLGKTQ